MPTPTLYMGLPNPTPFSDSGTWAGDIVACNVGFDTLAVYRTVSVSVTGSLAVYNGTALIKATSAGGITLTLPDATITANAGRVYIIVKVDAPAGAVTLNGFGGQTISGQASVTVVAQWNALAVQSDGANWIVIGRLNESVTGILPVADGGTGSNLSATGGASQVLRQSSVGGNVTVSQLAASDLSNGVTGTGAVVLANAPTFTANPTFASFTGTGAVVLATSPSLVTPAIGNGGLTIAGSTSGTQTIKTAAMTSGTITFPAGSTDYSGTGGASFVLRQSSVGAAITVSQLAASDLTNGTTGSGAVVLVTAPTVILPIVGTAVSTTSAYLTASNAGGSFIVGRDRLAGGDLATGSLTYAGVLTVNDAHALQFGTNTTIRMTIDSSGNVGIGTATPHVQFESMLPAARNTAYSAADLTTWADELVWNPTSTAGAATGIAFAVGPTYNNNFAGGIGVVKTNNSADDGAYMVFVLRAEGFASAEKMRLTASGLTIADTITSYNGTATAGNGVGSIVGATSQRSETAADANVLTVTPPATAGSYRLRFVMSVSAATAAILGWTATWKDSNGNAQTPTNLALFQSGTALPALTFTTSAAGNYYADADIDIDNSATAIVVQLTFTGTSFAAKVSATIERII